jgi:hypothetical protein
MTVRCATAARHRGDPLVGTAAPARRWLLVEYPWGWEPAALDSGELAGPVGTGLHETALAVGGRAVLVRRPGRRRLPAELQWGVVDVGGAEEWGTWSRVEDLVEAAEVLRRGPSRQTVVAPGGEPLLLVCTHGRHDTCCAVRGRPVAAALALQWPERTWECSHVGGDRFAANLVVLPDGTVYGGLDAARVVDVVREHRAGSVALDHLRGFSAEQPHVQAAMAAVLAARGPGGPADLVVRSQHRDTDGSWRVLLEGRRAPLPRQAEVVVAGRPSAPAKLTCRAPDEGVATVWETVSLTVT